MSIITLTTDYGLRDHFVGSLKGKIYSVYPQATIVDITHFIAPFNISETNYILNASYSSFPIGTVHIVGVDCERNFENQHVAIKWNDHYFLAADNGVLSLLTQIIPAQKIIKINIHEFMLSNATDMDALVKVAVHLSKGGLLHEVGEPILALKDVTEVQPVASSDLKTIKGNVIYIDNFGNVVTNITKSMFEKIGKKRPFQIVTRGVTISSILNRYSDLVQFSNTSINAQVSNKVAIFNENKLLEIALYKSNPDKYGAANSLLGFNYRDVVTVEFLSE